MSSRESEPCGNFPMKFTKIHLEANFEALSTFLGREDPVAAPYPHDSVA